MSRLIPKDRHSPKEFSLRFRMLMAFHNLTLERIAEWTGNAISTVGTWKNGRLPNSKATLEKIAEFFHVSLDYLLTGSTQGLENSAAVAKVQEVSSQIMQKDSAMHRYPMPPYYGMPMHPVMHHHQPYPHPMQMNHAVHTPVPNNLRAQIEGYLKYAEMTGNLSDTLNTLQELYPNSKQ